MTTTPQVQISKQSESLLKAIPASEKLGFGNYFTDHLFSAKYTVEGGWSEACVKPYGPISLDPAASVFHYGQALFEGMKVFRRKDGSIWCFRPEFNQKRFSDGATRLCLQPPPAELFMNGIRELVKLDSRWVPQDEDCALYIRPTLIGTEGFLGVRPSREELFFVILSPVGSYYAEGSAPVKIWVENKALRAAPGGLGAVKAGANYAASLQAALDAKKKGFSQVLWLDVEKEGIEEVGTMNVFFVFKNEIVTPALNGSILPGGVRDSVIQLLKSWKKPIVERRITIQEIFDRHQKNELVEAFGTGTAATISRIGELQWDAKNLKLDAKENKLSSEILATLTGIQRGTLPDTFEWMRPLDKL